MNRSSVYSISAMILLLSLPELAHASRYNDHWHHHRHGHDSVMVVGQPHPGYYPQPYYYAIPAPTFPYTNSYIPAPVLEPETTMPQPIYSTDSNASYCREFTRNIMIDGSKQKAYGTACRTPDGNWQIQGN